MKRILYILVMSVAALAVQAQSTDKMYSQAQREYSNGHFQQCEEIALKIIPHSEDMLTSSVYRLLALCRLQQGDQEGAKQYVIQLLNHDPYFAPSIGDPQRFLDLVADNRQQGVTITTASQHAETLEESPVPVTVITEEMIAHSGAQTLRDLLCMYVPSMTRVDGIEANVGMRGVAGNTQETILILLDGHRLNSGATNAEAPDFRNSLYKIKQIEVLRGAASSQYGNVALMAVVNIITKKGIEMDGSSFKGRYGSFSTWGVDGLFGKGNLRTDILAWGSIYASKGEQVMYEGTPHYIDGYRQKPAYDIGIKARWGNLSLTFCHQSSKPVPFFNQMAIGPYTYDKYKAEEGSGPGAARNTTHAYIDYDHTWKGISFSATLYGNQERTNIYNVIADDINIPALAYNFKDVNLWMLMGWDDFSAGMKLSASTDYTIGSQKGSLLLGGQADIYNMVSSKGLIGNMASISNAGQQTSNAASAGGDNQISSASSADVTTYPEVIGLNTEHTWSAYLQIKNYFTKWLIFNGGLRYDSKYRHDGSIKTISPRVSLIWMPNSEMNFKLNYSHSFVDAPYLYRAGMEEFFGRKVDIAPQTNDAIQISGARTWVNAHLNTELNFFYNRIRDLCIFSFQYSITGAGTRSLTTADVDVAGVEGVVSYKTKGTFAQMNVSYKYPVYTRDYMTRHGVIFNDPAFTLNLTAAQRLYSSEKAGTFNLRANVHFQTATEMSINYYEFPSAERVNDSEHCPPQALVNAGADWLYRFLRISLDAYNLFNSNYRIGTSLHSWMPAQGFKFVGSVAVKF